VTHNNPLGQPYTVIMALFVYIVLFLVNALLASCFVSDKKISATKNSDISL